MTGSTTPRKAATAQLMDSIPSTQPLDTTGAVSIATAPVLTGHPDNSDNVSNAQHSTMLFPDAMNALVDASLPLKAAAVRTTGGQDQGTRFIPQTPTTPVEGAAMRAMQQQQSVAQEQAQTNTIPEGMSCHDYLACKCNQATTESCGISCSCFLAWSVLIE